MDPRYTGIQKFKVRLTSVDDQVSTEFTLEIKDTQSPPNLSFEFANQNIIESTASGEIYVEANIVSTLSYQVPYSFVNSSAINGTHFAATNGVLTFSPGETRKKIEWANTDNAVTNPTRVFQIQLGAVTGDASLGNVQQHTVNIIDDESPTFIINDVTANQGSSLSFQVGLSPTSFQTVTVDYALANGTAIAGTHYTTQTGTLTFNPGETSKNITVNTNSILAEACAPDRSFQVQLSNATLANIGDATGVGTIEDPKLPAISIADSSGSENASAAFTVSLDKACTTRNVEFIWTTANGTALAGTDYTSVSTAGTIAAGQTSTTLNVSHIDNSTYQGSRQYTVSLSSLVSATSGGDLEATGTITDNEFPLGTFSITGVTSDSESILDAGLGNGTEPIINWQTSTSATSYDVTIFADDGTSVVCATQNTTATTFDFGATCSLTPAQYYKASVIAKANSDTLAATNSQFRFYVNQSPTLGSGGNGVWYVLGGSSITIQAAWAASPAVGVATDPESQSMSFTSLGSASLGAISVSTSAITYTPTAGAATHGADQFTYTIKDSMGGTLTGTIQIYVVQAFTWTGAVSSSWTNPSNWCGFVSADKRSCLGNTMAPSTSAHNVYVDEVCSSAFSCTPTTAANLTLGGIYIKRHGFQVGTGYTLSVGTIRQSDGAFVASSGMLTIRTSAQITGGSFKASSTNTRLDGGDLTMSGTATFDHSSGTLQLSGYADLVNLNGSNLHHLEALNNVSFGSTTVVGTQEVEGNLLASNGYNCTVSGSFVVHGNLDIATSTNGVTWGNIKLVGANPTIRSSQQTLIGSFELAISGTAVLEPASVLNVRGDFTNTTGNITNTGAKFIMSGASKTYKFRNIVFDYLDFDFHTGSTAVLDGDITVLSGLGIGCYAVGCSLNGSTISLYGDLQMIGDDLDGGSTVVKMLGGAVGDPVYITGSTGSDIGFLEINSPGDVVFNPGGIIEMRNYKYIAGNLTTTGSHIRFTSPSGVYEPGNNQYDQVSIRMDGGSSATLVGSLYVNGDLAIWGNVLPRLNGGTIYARKNVTYTGSFANTSTTQFVLDGTVDQVISKTSTTYQFPGSVFTINKASGKVLLGANTTMANTQTLSILNGVLDMAGFNFSVRTLSLNSTSVIKNGGTLTVNSVVINASAAPQFGGSILDN